MATHVFRERLTGFRGQMDTELRYLAARKMAKEQPGQTLQPTALVHEVWLRLGGDAHPLLSVGLLQLVSPTQATTHCTY